jgi:hypothetical protein
MDGNPTELGWQLCVLSRIVPIMLLAVCILMPVAIPIVKDIIAFAAIQGNY